MASRAEEAGGAEARGYPEMPWRLRSRGTVAASLHWVDVRCARTLVPPELSVLRFLPGWTIGGLFLAEYGPGSDLQYNELIVGAATVWHRRRPALWITDLFVDDPASVAGGRALLGAPKHLAPFTRAEGEITVGDPAAPVCRARYRPRLWLWKQRVRLAALHRDVREFSGATAALHGQEMAGRWGLARVEVEVPPESPLRRLGLGDLITGFCGRDATFLLGGAPFLPLRLLTVTPAAAPQRGLPPVPQPPGRARSHEPQCGGP